MDRVRRDPECRCGVEVDVDSCSVTTFGGMKELNEDASKSSRAEVSSVCLISALFTL